MVHMKQRCGFIRRKVEKSMELGQTLIRGSSVTTAQEAGYSLGLGKGFG
jgi:hypothetical protein